jgi:hypothetical protein
MKMRKFHPVIESTIPPRQADQPVQTQTTKKLTLVSTVKLSTGLEMEHIKLPQ